MLLSLALVFLCGMALGALCQRLGLPRLLGMLIAGLLLGPYALNALDGTLLAVSPVLRRIALIIILTRAGLTLRPSELRQVGRPAILLCFLPACCEIAGVLLLAPPLLGLSLAEAAVAGAVVAAVSPAVIVPKMLTLMREGYGTQQRIPQMLLAGASVDDIFVIVLFTAFTGLAAGGEMQAAQLLQIPLSIVLGLGVGAVCGLALSLLFGRLHLRDSSKVLLFLSISFLLVSLEDAVTAHVGFSGLLAIMSMGAALGIRRPAVAQRMASKYEKMWVGAEVLLFVLVGAQVNLPYAFRAGGAALAVILGALCFRMAGVLLCVAKTRLTRRERIFCMLAYLPKATVQAAIGALPLAMGLPCGEAVLTVAVLSILITAPLGAFAIERTYRRLLQKEAE